MIIVIITTRHIKYTNVMCMLNYNIYKKFNLIQKKKNIYAAASTLHALHPLRLTIWSMLRCYVVTFMIHVSNMCSISSAKNRVIRFAFLVFILLCVFFLLLRSIHVLRFLIFICANLISKYPIWNLTTWKCYWIEFGSQNRMPCGTSNSSPNLNVNKFDGLLRVRV